MTDILAISAGGGHTCALNNRGALLCWGDNAYGQLGDGSTDDSPLPVIGAELTSGIHAVSAGETHTCAIINISGQVVCWGRNNMGQVGNGDTDPHYTTPQGVDNLEGAPDEPKATALSAGAGHTCVILETGYVRCWGSNDYGQLGDNTITTRRAATDLTCPDSSD
ncbi:MAG: hypothetical protein ABIJ56_18290 [Pseudomonadota bacterium]